jgi:hypothetical protein
LKGAAKPSDSAPREVSTNLLAATGLERVLQMTSLILFAAAASMELVSTEASLALAAPCVVILLVALGNHDARRRWRSNRGLGVAAVLSLATVGLLGAVSALIINQGVHPFSGTVRNALINLLLFSAAAASCVIVRWRRTSWIVQNEVGKLDAMLASGITEPHCLQLAWSPSRGPYWAHAVMLYVAAILGSAAVPGADAPVGWLLSAILGGVLWSSAALFGTATFEGLSPATIFVEGRLPSRAHPNPQAFFEAAEDAELKGPPPKVYQARPDESESRGFAGQFRPDGTTEDRPIT